MRRAVLVAALALGACQPAWSQADLQKQQAQVRREQAELRERLEAVARDITESETARKGVVQKLRASETAISDINRELQALGERTAQAQQRLDDAGAEQGRQQQALEARRAELAALLRAQYASGLSPWTALLSGNDPHDIGRELRYLAYVSESQAKAVERIQATLRQLQELQAGIVENRKMLDSLDAETRDRQRALLEQQEERRKVLASIESELREQKQQEQRLIHDEQRLGQLVDKLGKAIAQERERARQEQARRVAEAKRQEEARRQEEAQRREEARQQAARQEEQAAPAPAAPASDAPPRPPAVDPGVAAAPSREGLARGLPPPVRASGTLGRFGGQRPDGGVWRGIVLLAPEGRPVSAVASGRVVYASWLSGFGNLIIIDHGKQYLSIYGYNQSLLKQVGDTVRAGDSVATVGSTGGQVEPGLYFEIRQGGVPVNPQLWLGR